MLFCLSFEFPFLLDNIHAITATLKSHSNSAPRPHDLSVPHFLHRLLRVLRQEGQLRREFHVRADAVRVEGDGLVLARELLQRARPGRGTPGRQEAQEGK